MGTTFLEIPLINRCGMTGLRPQLEGRVGLYDMMLTDQIIQHVEYLRCILSTA